MKAEEPSNKPKENKGKGKYPKIDYVFDYEINSVKIDENEDLNCKMYYYDSSNKTYRLINYNAFNDKQKPLPVKPDPQSLKDNQAKPVSAPKIKKANCIKRLVSKNKIRYENEYYDLDMAYITDRVIAMGFPSSGCETFYRNSISDVIRFFHQYHRDKVKIYNLCLENERIYPKTNFEKGEVGLFPALDHNPCPIKLILEFCIDICLYLIKNKNGIAAVHCKAGKGRTGVMICSYLIFSNICSTSEIAFDYYAKIRTKDETGVTIPSQRRYIKYFETFLESNFCPPYIYLIPKIIKYHFSSQIDKQGRPHVTNILQSFEKDNSYFVSPNVFMLNGLQVGPVKSKKNLSVKICHFVDKNLNSNGRSLKEVPSPNNQNMSYYNIEFNPPLRILSDTKISISGGVNFYVWVNLWYSSWEKIKAFYEENHKKDLIINEEEDKKEESKKEKKDKGKDKDKDKDKKKHGIANETNDIDNDSKFGLASVNRELKTAEMNFEIHSESSECPSLRDDNHQQSLYEIIFKLKHNTDLNLLIKALNDISTTKLNESEMSITLQPWELDKFAEVKTEKDCTLSIFYSLTKEK